MSTTGATDFPELFECVYKGQDGVKRVEQIVIRLLTLHLAESKRSLEINDGG